MGEELKQLLGEVDTLKVQLSALRSLPEEALKKIQDALDIEYTYESNRIEGNTLTLQETALVVNEGVTISGKSMREHLEAINHYLLLLIFMINLCVFIRLLTETGVPLVC